jgi:GWxTD domain-containing protein
MMRTLLVLGAAVVPLASQTAGQVRDAITVRPVRFYSLSTGTTLIEGVGAIPLEGMPASAGEVRFRIEVTVSDSAGMELIRSGWDRSVPAAVTGVSGASTVESFRFALEPGRYRVTLRAVPAGGTPLEQTSDIVAYARRPMMSDVVLATAAREVAAEATLEPGEIRRGDLALLSAPVPRLTLTEAALSYYAEVYSWTGAPPSASLQVEVLAASGRTIVRAAPQQVAVPETGGAVRGTIDLAGLPEGDYRLRLRLQLGDSVAAQEGSFAMTAPRPVAAAAPAAADPFDGLSEATLDSMYAPLMYLARDEERGVYERLTEDGKRRFIREFWRRRDPSPGTPDNPAMVEFYRAVTYANQTYREGGAAQIPGWRTDRGRIYLRHGRPDEMLSRPSANPRPFVVWVYTRERFRWYLFRDDSGFGHYRLVATNDRFEPGLTEFWERLLDREAAEEVARFLNR